MQIKLTDKAREALLFAELIAWARKDSTVQANTLCLALLQQSKTTAKKVLAALKEKNLDKLSLFENNAQHLFKALGGKLALKFNKIPLGDSIYKALEKSYSDSLELGYDEEITTGLLLLELIFDTKEFGDTVKHLKIDLAKLKQDLLSIAFDEDSLRREIESGDENLSQFNRRVLSWLREGNLTEDLMKSCGINDSEILADRKTIKFIEYFSENQNKEIPGMKPSLTRGIREKARRDLEVIDSFVSAKNLPNAQPNLLGMYMNNPEEFILFFEDGFATGLEPEFMPYKDIQSIDVSLEDELEAGRAIASIAITRDDDLDVEVNIPTCTNNIPDVLALENFLYNAQEPQDISKIVTHFDFVTFLKRQNENLDLYYRLAYKTEELGQLGWQEADEEKGAQHTLLLRLLAILVTVPVQSLSLSVSRSKLVS